MLICLAWGIFFWLKGKTSLMMLDVFGVASGSVVLMMLGKNKLRIAEYLLLASLFVLLCVNCLYFDIPNAAAPRVAHQYFLPLALFTYLFFENGKKWLRIAVISLFLGAFLLFASTNFGFVTPYLIPDNVRIVGSWFHNIAVIILLCSLIHIARLDFTKHNQLLEDLRLALQLNQLELYYQAQVDQDGKVCGAEALLRWNHPSRGMVLPYEFVPIAEQNALILPIGRWVLDTASQQLEDWANKPAFKHLTLSINISAKQFHQSQLVEDVKHAAKRYSKLSGKLKMELTETVLIQDMEDVIVKMNELKTLGVSFALDDFGTGYSSLNYLTRLPLDQLKIDQSFVRDMLTNENSAAIAKTITSLGHSLGLQVVAEGVETQAQIDFLLAQGCNTFQGYYFSHPLPIGAFEDMVAQDAKKHSI